MEIMGDKFDLFVGFMIKSNGLSTVGKGSVRCGRKSAAVAEKVDKKSKIFKGEKVNVERNWQQ